MNNCTGSFEKRTVLRMLDRMRPKDTADGLVGSNLPGTMRGQIKEPEGQRRQTAR
jgi:hypothetical protein